MSFYAVTAKVYVVPSIPGMVREGVLFLITQRWKSGVSLHHAPHLVTYQPLVVLHLIC